MTKDNFIKFLEEKKIKLDQKKPVVKQARDAGYNRALEDVIAYVCCEPIEKLPKLELSRIQLCGCIICYCEGEQCHNCGAKHCRTHEVGSIPNPIYNKYKLKGREDEK